MKTAPKTVCCRNYRRYDHNELKDNLKNAGWSPVYISHSKIHYKRLIEYFIELKLIYLHVQKTIKIIKNLITRLEV